MIYVIFLGKKLLVAREYIRKKGVYMSRRMYIASRSKLTNKDLIQIEMHIENMMQSADFSDYFLNDEFLKRLTCKVEIELGNDGIAEMILEKCTSYLPKILIEKYPEYLPQDSSDEKYIGILTEDRIMEMISKIHQDKLLFLKNQLEESRKDNQYAEYYIQSKLNGEYYRWQISMDYLNKKQVPYCFLDTLEYEVFQLWSLLNKTDFSKTDLIIFGW